MGPRQRHGSYIISIAKIKEQYPRSLPKTVEVVSVVAF
jgi:hypothetical protein